MLLAAAAFLNCTNTRQGEKWIVGADSVERKVIEVEDLATSTTHVSNQVESMVIEVEDLAFKGKDLPTIELREAAKKLVGEYDGNLEIVAVSTPEGLLVQEPHSFFSAVNLAYAEHRPIVITPDAVWMVVCQGFARHVSNNAEELRPLFVDFEGKKTLKLNVPKGLINKPGKDWEPYFDQFAKQIGGYVGEDLSDVLGTRFSTSTSASLAASRVTVMAAFREYFDYWVLEMCGIPTVILEGTPSDWHKVVENTKMLRKYKLEWWVDALVPILEKFEQASLGEVDKAFWRRMFKIHDVEHEECGDPYTQADGWIGRFYPYDSFERRRSDGTSSISRMEIIYDPGNDLPGDLVNVPIMYKDIEGKEIELTLWTGFIGVCEDRQTHALKPQVGWFITKK